MSPDGDWEKVTAVVDSGAGENVMPENAVKFIPIVPTARSKAGRGFCGPSGEHIKNYGQKKVEVKTAEGQVRMTTWQVASVKRPLMSVSRMTAAGNDVNLSDKQPHIVNKKNGQKTALRKEGNVFVVDLWIRMPPPPGLPSSGTSSRAPRARRNNDMEMDCITKPGFTRQAPW